MDNAIEIDETTRVVVTPDESGYSIEEYLGDGVGIQTLSVSRYLYEVSTSDEVTKVVSRVKDSIHYHSHDDYTEKRERVIGAWLTAKGYSYEFVGLQGYTQGDWAEVVVYAKADEIESLKPIVKDVRALWRGDVYTLTLQKSKVYTAEDGDILTDWEWIDAIGGVILHNEEDAEKYAREIFSL